jgi:hypothetical protein
MTQQRITELSTQLASSIAGKEPQDVKHLCKTFIELAAKEAKGTAVEALKNLIEEWPDTDSHAFMAARKLVEMEPNRLTT